MTTTQTPIDGATITGIDLSAYLVGDPQRSIAFYRDVLGLTPTDIDEKGRGAEFVLPDGSAFGVWRPEEGARTSGGTMMFAVGDIRAAIERFRSKGAAISEPEESPVCFMAFGEDPDGNPIIIHQRKAK